MESYTIVICLDFDEKVSNLSLHQRMKIISMCKIIQVPVRKIFGPIMFCSCYRVVAFKMYFKYLTCKARYLLLRQDVIKAVFLTKKNVTV